MVRYADENMMRLEHIGIAVKDVDASVDLLEKLLQVVPYKKERVDREGVCTHFISANTAKLELLEALGPDTPVARHIEKRGQGLHHLAFEVDNIHKQLRRVQEQGFTPLSEEPRFGADGKLIFFLHPKQTGGVLIEFCQSTPTPLEPTPIPYNEGHLTAYVSGRPDSPPLILLHGAAGSTLTETEPLFRRLEQHFHVMALDFAGHGTSSLFSSTSFTFDLFADNIRGVLDHFGHQDAHIFGFSMGGVVALKFAVQHPDRVKRMVVHGANTDWTPDLVADMLKRIDISYLESESPKLVARLEEVHMNWRELFSRMVDFVQALPSQSLVSFVEHLHQPILVTSVDHDDLFPLSSPLDLHRILPNSSLALIPGNRHALSALDLDSYLPILLRHLLKN